MNQHPYFDLSDIEAHAKGKDVASLTIAYAGNDIPYRYEWEDRTSINWSNVAKCRLNFTNKKWHVIDGDACSRPGFKIKGKNKKG